MPLIKEDRITFSGKIATSEEEIKGLDMAAAAVQKALEQAQALDEANKRLGDPTQAFILKYQAEFGNLDGQVRSVFVEQDIIDSANKKLGNYFFPNNAQLSIPSLSGTNNVWTKVKPFALAFGVGKNYDQSYTLVTGEAAMLTQALAYITAAALYTDIQNTTGQHCVNGGTCSNPLYTDEATCLLNGGIWTPSETIEPFPDIQTLKTDLVAKVNQIVAMLNTELTNIVTNDPDPTNAGWNTAALNDINNVILPALNTWLAYVDFNTSHGQTTCAGFNGYNANLLAPTKLHSTELAALQLALQNRQTFITTRQTQLNTILGTVNQNISTGDVTGSGLFFRRYQFLNLRINVLNGSLTDLASLQAGQTAQNTIKQNTIDAVNLYKTILPTSTMQQSATDTAVLSLIDPSPFNPGDTVYVMADDQEELLRAVKSKNGSVVILNDVVPSKYKIESNLRIYKDVT